jgi:hypothetical protein
MNMTGVLLPILPVVHELHFVGVVRQYGYSGIPSAIFISLQTGSGFQEQIQPQAWRL